MWVNPKGPLHHGHKKAQGIPNEMVESKTGLADGKWHHTTVTFDQYKVTDYVCKHCDSMVK